MCWMQLDIPRLWYGTKDPFGCRDCCCLAGVGLLSDTVWTNRARDVALNAEICNGLGK